MVGFSTFLASAQPVNSAAAVVVPEAGAKMQSELPVAQAAVTASEMSPEKVNPSAVEFEQTDHTPPNSDIRPPWHGAHDWTRGPWITGFLAVVNQPIAVTDNSGSIIESNSEFDKLFYFFPGSSLKEQNNLSGVWCTDWYTLLTATRPSTEMLWRDGSRSFSVRVQQVKTHDCFFLFAFSSQNFVESFLESTTSAGLNGQSLSHTPVEGGNVNQDAKPHQASRPRESTGGEIGRSSHEVSALKPYIVRDRSPSSLGMMETVQKRHDERSNVARKTLALPNMPQLGLGPQMVGVSHDEVSAKCEVSVNGAESNVPEEPGNAYMTLDPVFSGSAWDNSWLESAAHMVRTYVNGILGMSQLLASTDTTPEQETYTREIRIPAEALVNVVSDIVDRFEMSEGKIKPQSANFSLRMCLESAMEAVAKSTVYSQEHQTFEVASYLNPEKSWDVLGDASLIKRIVLNISAYLIETWQDIGLLLLVAEQECTQDVVFVSVEIRALNLHNEPCSLCDDNIKPCQPGFEKEATVISKLWLAQRLVGELKGDTLVKDNFSTLRFRIPFRHPTRIEQPDFPSYTYGKDFIMKPSILIIEPLDAMRDIYERYVSAWGFKVIAVSNLSEAEKALNSSIMVSFVLLSMQAASFNDSPGSSPLLSWREQKEAADSCIGDTFESRGGANTESGRRARSPPLRRASDSSCAHKEASISMFSKVLDMKMDCFKGVAVIVLTPFRDQADFKLPERDAFAWKILSKPCGLMKLYAALSSLLTDGPADQRPSTSIDRPVSESSGLSHPPRNLSVDGPTPFRILIVDNHPVNQKLHKFIIEQYFASDPSQPICDVAVDGIHACNCVIYAEYDLVLMDMNMPGMTGEEATAHIRTLEEHDELSSFGRPLTIIGMPATTRKFTEEEYTAMGMDGFLPFPIDRTCVNGMICEHMERSRKHQPPVFDIDRVLNICEGSYSFAISMLDEFVRTSLLHVGMLRNRLIIEQQDTLMSTAEAIRLAATRFGAPWLKRAVTEFVRLLPDPPTVQTIHSITDRSEQKPEMKLRSIQLRALAQVETEILVIGQAAVSLRKSA